MLLTVDESTYNESDGNTTDDDHPVSWCKRFDGGRMFYTALGHTNQSFTEAPFLQHLLAGIDVAAGYASDASCGIFRTSTDGGAGGTVASTLSLTLGTPGAFGTFARRERDLQRVHERERDLDRRRRAAVGRRPQRHRDRAPGQRCVLAPAAGPGRGHEPAGTGAALAPLSTTGAPLSLLTYAGPVSNDAVTLSFRQAIALHRRAPDRRVRQDADVHAVDDRAVSAQRT